MIREGELDARQFGMLCVSVIAAIAPHLVRFAPPLAGFLLFLLIARWMQRRYRPFMVRWIIKLPLTLLLLCWIVSQYGNLFGRDPGSALACSMLVLKLIESERHRDARAAVMFGSFVLMSALLFSQGLFFTLTLCSFIAIFLVTLRELQPRATAVVANAAFHRGDLRKGLASAALSLLAAAPIAVCAFAFLPRLASPLWGAPGPSETAHTGIDERMTPGSISQLLVDDTPAFRVRFDNAPPAQQQRYWRGIVMTSFDGSTWSRQQPPFALARADALTAVDASVEYEITLDPTQQRWLFALDLPLTAPTDAVRTGEMALVARQPVTQLRQYRIRSALNYQLDLKLPPERRAQALQLPLGIDPRSRSLARQWRTESNGDAEVLQKALQLFHASFSYTLNPPQLDGPNSIDGFLFNTRQGFCEHFSSAFVFLMRAADIPARVVTGYQGGYFNPIGNYLVVRQSDAHAWAEVWLENKGWVRVDPTAAVSPERITSGAGFANGAQAAWYRPEWLLLWRNRLDLVNQLWNSSILQFNALRQASVLQPLGLENAGYAELVGALAVSVIAILSLFTAWVLYRSRRPVERLDAAYARFCRKLAKAGVERRATEGPADFGKRAAVALPHNEASIRILSARYIGLRYGRLVIDEGLVRKYAAEVHAWRLR